MPGKLIEAGVPINLIQNEVYAMPAHQTAMFCDTGGAVIEKAIKSDFVLNSSINFTNGVAPMPGGCFIRCTSGNVSIVVSRQ